MYLEHPFAVADNNNNAVAPEPYEAQVGITTQIAPIDSREAPAGLLGPIEVSIAPGRGTFFDEHIDMSEPQGTALTMLVLEYLDAKIPRDRKRKQRDQADHAIRVRKLLANGLRCHFHRDPPRTSIFCGATAYPDKARWQRGEKLGVAVTMMEKQGLLVKLDHHRPSDKAKRYTSSYVVTDTLEQWAEECGVTASLIRRRQPQGDLVQLYGPKASAYWNSNLGGLVRCPKGERIYFNDMAQTQDWASRLGAINDSYIHQDLDIGLTDEQLAHWVDVRNANPERKGAPYRLPERIQTDLYRVFNNAVVDDPKFDQGGRLSGGWWMSVPKGLRPHIIINGLPTVELDYSACHPRMLYHERGLDPEGELYDLPELATYERATGVKEGTYRPCVKWLMQVLINCKGRPEAAARPEEVQDLLAKLPFKLKEIIGYIKNRHQPIADWFESGAGMRLMKIESDIALEVIETAMNEGWVALPIHDSFIASRDKEDRLRQQMNEAYERILGKKPEIKRGHKGKELLLQEAYRI